MLDILKVTLGIVAIFWIIAIIEGVLDELVLLPFKIIIGYFHSIPLTIFLILIFLGIAKLHFGCACLFIVIIAIIVSILSLLSS